MRIKVIAFTIGLAVALAGACTTKEVVGDQGDDDDDGSGNGSSTGGSGGSGSGGSGAGPLCPPDPSLTPEQQYRRACESKVNHPDWGHCQKDPPVADATDICRNQPICDGCPYNWFESTWIGLDCLAELAAFDCCQLSQPSPFIECETGFCEGAVLEACWSGFDDLEPSDPCYDLEQLFNDCLYR